MSRHRASRRSLSVAAATMLTLCLPLVDYTLAAPSIWRDHATGFAMAGYDPVAYHTRGKPVPGEDGMELRWGGAVWKFVNTGNRDAFAMHPRVYVPRFAGYDAEALSRGLTVTGNPLVWAQYKGRVYLFRDIASLRTWREDPETLIGKAEANWQRLGDDLPGTSER